MLLVLTMFIQADNLAKLMGIILTFVNSGENKVL